MNIKRKAICLAVILVIFALIVGIAAVCHIASSFNGENPASFKKEGFLTVKISGAVKKEGSYLVKQNTILYDCICMAGGTKKNADLTSVNLMEAVNDDCNIFIPKIRKGDMKVTKDIEFSSDGIYMKCNINKADKTVLSYLSGIGSKTASNIEAYREKRGFFKSKEELLNVKGIGVKTYNKIKDCITVGGEHK